MKYRLEEKTVQAIVNVLNSLAAGTQIGSDMTVRHLLNTIEAEVLSTDEPRAEPPAKKARKPYAPRKPKTALAAFLNNT